MFLLPTKVSDNILLFSLRSLALSHYVPDQHGSFFLETLIRLDEINDCIVFVLVADCFFPDFVDAKTLWNVFRRNA